MTDYVDVKPGLRFPRRIENAVGKYGEELYDVRFILAWADSLYRYEIEELAVVGTPKRGLSVTGAVLRSVRVQQALEHVMHNMHRREDPIRLSDGEVYEMPYEWDPEKHGPDVMAVPKERLLPNMSKKEFEEARLLEAARLHVIGEAFGARSLRLVQDVLQVTQRSASRLIDKAKERGLIDPPATDNV